MRTRSAFFSLALAFMSCGSPASDTAPPDPEVSAARSALSKNQGAWFMTGVGFGPCGGLPDTCTVGEFVDAKAGPKDACYSYECKRPGTWVATSAGFGPCGGLPAACAVGDVVDAHPGSGSAGGCYTYECKDLGTWVLTGAGFAPCGPLPKTCTVGEELDAYAGTSGRVCYHHSCR